MPIANYKHRAMRMNVSSQLLLHELALKANCNYNPEKEEIKEISTEISMQCMQHDLSEKNLSNAVVNGQHRIDQQVLNKIVSSPKVRRNFIPYPDHNYGQQPPLTPPAEAGKLIRLKSESIHERKERDQTSTEGEQEGATKCICGFEHDDGYMICCDDCSSWQHVECMGIKSSKVPEKYSCHKCNPRELDIEKAKAIQAKKRENMSEGDDEGEEDETASEDEASKTMYTAISNTPTRITLLSSGSNQILPTTRSKKGTRVQKRKLSDQRNTRRKTRKRDKTDDNVNANSIDEPFLDSDSVTNYFSSHKLYEEIDENKYDSDFQNIHVKLSEVIPSIDFKKVLKCHTVIDVTPNRKGLVASCDISAGNFILEFKGMLMLRQKFEELNPIFKQSCPYIVSYNKIDTLQLVIDARAYGNDARFIRHSCTPNAELQHLTANGSLHIMIISQTNIVKDCEITIPFDFPIEMYKGFMECACHNETCIVRQQNMEWKRKNRIDNSDAMQQQTVNDTYPKTELNELQIESESDSSVMCEESKHEKLSREERKLQALMKQFEKLERKQDILKKPKTPILKANSIDENTVPGNGIQKALSVKKFPGNKRKMSTSGRRRTRQSSCSSEPVSPAENEPNSSLSTPTTPLSNSHPQTLFENMQMLRQRGKKDKEPLTLTLPIHRKIKQDPAAASPTPPGTPIGLLSPARSVGEPSSLSLSLDTLTQLESTPSKAGLSNGLLQIVNTVPTTPLSTSLSSSFGNVTAEERIGDLTSRFGETQPSSPASNYSFNQNYRSSKRKYYGSLKKHWLRQHYKSTATTLYSPTVTEAISINGSKQISLAALVASISQQHHKQNMLSALNPMPVFKKPQSCIPLKKRFLLRAAKCNESRTVTTNALSHSNERESTVDINQMNERDRTRKNIEVLPNILCDNSTKHSSGNAEYIQTSTVDPTSTRTNSCETESLPTVKNIPKIESVTFNNDITESKEESKIDVMSTVNKNDSVMQINLDSSKSVMNIDPRIESKKRTLSGESSNDEPCVKKPYLDDSMDESSDNGLKIVVTEPCSVSEAISLNPIAQSDVIITTPQIVLQTKAEHPSPRSSIDSNPDVEQSYFQGGEQGTGGKKKLSFKEYRNRIRSQKISTSSQPPLPAEDTKSQPPLPTAPASPGQKIHQAADMLLTPRTVSLLSAITNVTSTSKPRLSNEPLMTQPATKLLVSDTSTPKEVKTGKTLDLVKRQSSERSQSTSSSNSVFEPVSPGNDFDAVSPREESGSAYGRTIHTEITKNPFSIHNDITKHPFGKKQNQGPGLLQYLSAQKYPHLATLMTPNNTKGGAQPSSGNHYRSQQSAEYHPSDTLENDDDASSTHSNMSSTSYGSSSDVLHDRAYSNRPPYVREHNNRESREYYPNQPHPPYPAPLFYQSYNQHPPVSRSSNLQRNGFNSYHPSQSQGSRPRPSHRGYLPFQ